MSEAWIVVSSLKRVPKATRLTEVTPKKWGRRDPALVPVSGEEGRDLLCMG